MKKLCCTLFLLLLLNSCVSGQNQTAETASETFSPGAVTVLELAIEEFHQVFAEFEGLQIEQTSTMTRTDDIDNIVVQITYTSDNGEGVYGFEYRKDDSGDFILLSQGENVTVDNLVTIQPQEITNKELQED